MLVGINRETYPQIEKRRWICICIDCLINEIESTRSSLADTIDAKVKIFEAEIEKEENE